MEDHDTPQETDASGRYIRFGELLGAGAAKTVYPDFLLLPLCYSSLFASCLSLSLCVSVSVSASLSLSLSLSLSSHSSHSFLLFSLLLVLSSPPIICFLLLSVEKVFCIKP
ncbi:putative serine/threonine-protein kinase wnk5 [Balamuthia mandrillaris]